jgi:hypothetical protein
MQIWLAHLKFCNTQTGSEKFLSRIQLVVHGHAYFIELRKSEVTPCGTIVIFLHHFHDLNPPINDEWHGIETILMQALCTGLASRPH